MSLNSLLTTTLLGIFLLPQAAPSQSCRTGVRAEGIVTDPSGGHVAGARVLAATGESTSTDDSGHFLLPCLPDGEVSLRVEAENFTPAVVTADKKAGEVTTFSIRLSLAPVKTTVEVGDNSPDQDPSQPAGSFNLKAKDIVRLADDPDDFKRQLQVLAAASGAGPLLGLRAGLQPRTSLRTVRR